jgi:chemosensory pili system protein ChpE
MFAVDASLTAALALGIAYAALPGVVNTEAIRRGVRAGFAQAASVQIGALTGDALWAAIALTGVTLFLEHEVVALTLGIVGAGFLFHLARVALLSALHGGADNSAPAKPGSSLLTGLIFSLANPAGLAFWTGIGGGLLGASGEASFARSGGLLLMFVLGALCWGVGMSALVAWGRRFATPRLFRAIDALCGILLGVFGVRLLWTTLQRYGRLLTLIPRALR